jgi:phosphopantothenate-cysteine ligase
VDYLVTAGGTAERVDGVRSITNCATGRLGARIAEKLVRQGGRVFYVCGKNAARPNAGFDATSLNSPSPLCPIEVISVEGVSDLEMRVRELLSRYKIGAIVHSMAVSDYSVDRILDAAGREIQNRDKIGSSESELHLILKPTPKIIGLFRTLSPESLLIGFKLLNKVSETTLIDAGYALLQKNNAAAVLANDLAGISGENHTAYLIDAQKKIAKFETKEAIAEGICRFIQQNTGSAL